MKFDYDDVKFSELMLYLAELSHGDQQYGRVKLAKQLFFCDFDAFRAFGRPITAAVYRKQAQGPLAESFGSTITRLVTQKRAVERKTRLEGYRDRLSLTNIDLADLSIFTPDEVDLVRSVVDRLASLHGAASSELAHQFIGWRLASPGEIIPYYTAHLDEEPPAILPSDMERVRRFASS